MYCSNCGKPIAENNNYCAYCGNKIGENPAEAVVKDEKSSKTTILTQLKIQIAGLTPYDFLIFGLQIFAVILGLFFPLVQRVLSSGEVDFKIRGVFRAWSYINKHYNYDEGREMLHNNLQLLGVAFLFVVIFLIGFALLRNKRKLCALGVFAGYVVYCVAVMRMIGANYYSSPSYDTFSFTGVFWLGVVMLAIAMILTFGLHRNFKKITKLGQGLLKQEITNGAFVQKKQKEIKTMGWKVWIIVAVVVLFFLVLTVTSVR